MAHCKQDRTFPSSASETPGLQEQSVTNSVWGHNESGGLGNSVKAVPRAGRVQRKGRFPPLRTEKESQKGLP